MAAHTGSDTRITFGSRTCNAGVTLLDEPEPVGLFQEKSVCMCECECACQGSFGELTAKD